MAGIRLNENLSSRRFDSLQKCMVPDVIFQKCMVPDVIFWYLTSFSALRAATADATGVQYRVSPDA